MTGGSGNGLLRFARNDGRRWEWWGEAGMAGGVNTGQKKAGITTAVVIPALQL